MTRPTSTLIWQREFTHGRGLRLRVLFHGLWLLAAGIAGYVR